MATRTVKAGGGNFSATGTWVEGAVPTNADDVVTNGSSTGTLTIDVASACRSFTIANGVAVTHTSTLAIGDGSGGALNYTGAGTVSGAGVISFVATTGTTLTVTTAGKTMPGMTVNCGSTTTIQFADAVTATGATLTLTAGKWDWNGKTVTAGVFNYGNATARTITFGAATVTLTTAAGWTGTAVTNLTVTANTATVTMNGASATFAGGAQNWNGLTVALTGSGTATTSGAFTVAALTRTGTAATTDAFTPAAFTVTGTLTLGGNTTQGINRLLVQSSSVGTSVTITATGAAVVISGDVDFLDITISGSPSWTNAGSAFVGDALGNGSLITTNRTTPATQTATGTASFAWSTHGWTSRVPLPQDNVSIPNAFVAGRTVTADMPRLGADVSFAGATGSPIFSVSVQVNLYGSITLATGVAPSGTNSINLNGRSSHTITSAGATFTQAVTVNAPGGTYTLADNLTISRNASNAIFFPQGTLVDAGVTVTLSGASATFSPSGTLTMTGTWNFGTTAAATFWAPSGTVTATGSTIALTAASANTRIFAGGGKTYGTLTYTVAGSTGILRITGANTFAAINVGDARTLTLPSSTTTTVTTFNVNGTAGNVTTVNSSTGGTAGTISKSSGTVTCLYLSVKDSTATGGATWIANTSTSVSGNTGWLFNTVIGTQVTETDTANAGVAVITVAGVQATETDTPTAGIPVVQVPGSQATETDTATAGSAAVQVAGSQATETDDALAGSPSVVAGPVVPDTAGGGSYPHWPRPRQRPTLVKHDGTVWGVTVSGGWCGVAVVRSGAAEGFTSVEVSIAGGAGIAGYIVGITAPGNFTVGCCIRAGVTVADEVTTSGLTDGAPVRCGDARATTTSRAHTPAGVSSRSGSAVSVTRAAATTAWGSAIKVGAPLEHPAPVAVS